MAYYFDTSALVKLFITEVGSEALTAWLADRQPLAASSDLTRTELLRAIRRRNPVLADQARRLRDSLETVVLDLSVFDAAGRLEPAHLRSLDAIHLAAALSLGEELEGFVTYDDRLAEAARLQGIPVLSPNDRDAEANGTNRWDNRGK